MIISLPSCAFLTYTLCFLPSVIYFKPTLTQYSMGLQFSFHLLLRPCLTASQLWHCPKIRVSVCQFASVIICRVSFWCKTLLPGSLWHCGSTSAFLQGARLPESRRRTGLFPSVSSPLELKLGCCCVLL